MPETFSALVTAPCPGSCTNHSGILTSQNSVFQAQRWKNKSQQVPALFLAWSKVTASPSTEAEAWCVFQPRSPWIQLVPSTWSRKAEVSGWNFSFHA